MRVFDEDAWIKQAAQEEDGAFVAAGRIALAQPPGMIVGTAYKRSFKPIPGGSHQPLTLAADTEAAEGVVLVTGNGQALGRLFYDYLGATLNLEFLEPVAFSKFDAEIESKNGDRTRIAQVVIRNHNAVLLNKTDLTEDDVNQVYLSPQDFVEG